MTCPFTERFQIVTNRASDSDVRLTLIDLAPSDRQLAGLRGGLEGPQCLWARTLPTSFPIDATRVVDRTMLVGAVLITDPCYWTPALPFLYKFTVELDWVDGSKTVINETIGLRRWEVDGCNLRLERKRIVLRGAAVHDGDATTLAAARSNEAAMIVRNPDDAVCQEASRRGVALIADLRATTVDLRVLLRRLAWQPAVMLAIVDDVIEILDRPLTLPLAVVVSTDNAHSSEDDRRWASVLAIDLATNKRPPDWLVGCCKPVIAIRHGGAYADFDEARAACDRLQADLAPQFDLAGYFVAE